MKTCLRLRPYRLTYCRLHPQNLRGRLHHTTSDGKLHFINVWGVCFSLVLNESIEIVRTLDWRVIIIKKIETGWLSERLRRIEKYHIFHVLLEKIYTSMGAPHGILFRHTRWQWRLTQMRRWVQRLQAWWTRIGRYVHILKASPPDLQAPFSPTYRIFGGSNFQVSRFKISRKTKKTNSAGLGFMRKKETPYTILQEPIFVSLYGSELSGWVSSVSELNRLCIVIHSGYKGSRQVNCS